MERKKNKQSIREKIREMSVPETCLAFLRLLLCLTAVLYLVAIAVIMPLYFQWETAYVTIGTDKAVFFQKWGFLFGRLFLHILLFYLFFALLCWFIKNRNTKRKVAALINRILDDLSLTDKFCIVFLAGLCLSYYYTDYPLLTLLGSNGWDMGFWPQLVFIGSYFALSRFLTARMAKWAAGAMLVTSFLVFLLGLLNRYGVNPLAITTSGAAFISTIGNINWYCGYWSVLFPLGAGLFMLYGKRQTESFPLYCGKKAVLGIFAAVGFATGISQGSDSGVLALAALILLLGILAGKDVQRVKGFVELLLLFCTVTLLLALVQWLWPERNEYVTQAYALLVKTPLVPVGGILALIFYLFCKKEKRPGTCANVFYRVWLTLLSVIGVTLVSLVIMIMVNTLRPGSLGSLSDNPFFTFDQSWGSARGGTWAVGIKTWLSQDLLHKILGVGPDGMWAYIYNGPNATLLESVREQFGANRLTNAHGEWITILANQGLFGLIGFGGMMVSAILRFLKNKKGCMLCMACGASLFCYTVNNSFSFWQVMNVTQMFLVLGLGERLLRAENRGDEISGK